MSDPGKEREALSREERSALEKVVGPDARGTYRLGEQVWIAASNFYAEKVEAALAAREEPPAAEPEAEMVWGEGPYEQGEDTEQPDALSESAPRKGPHAPKGAKLALLGIDDAITCRASG